MYDDSLSRHVMPCHVMLHYVRKRSGLMTSTHEASIVPAEIASNYIHSSQIGPPWKAGSYLNLGVVKNWMDSRVFRWASRGGERKTIRVREEVGGGKERETETETERERERERESERERLSHGVRWRGEQLLYMSSYHLMYQHVEHRTMPHTTRRAESRLVFE